MAKKCKRCHHKCHCKDPLHADEYGVCVCERCKCDEKEKKRTGVQNEL